MKISFEQFEKNLTPQNNSFPEISESRGNNDLPKKDKGSYSVNIKSSDDLSAYAAKGAKKNKKSLADEIANADNYDSKTASRFMAVMSNTMSQKDFGKMIEEGYDPLAMDAGEAITNLDRIKVSLVESGTVIAGFNDNIDSSTVAEITGSAAAANKISAPEPQQLTDEEITKEVEKAFEKADLPLTDENLDAIKEAYTKAISITDLPDNPALYMVNNDLEPTIDNVYEAIHASGSGQYRAAKGYFSADGSAYMVSKADNLNINELNDQIDELIDSAGMEISDEIRNDAKWLVKNSVALTEKSLNLYEDLKKMELPPDDSLILSEIAEALSLGNEAGDAYLISGYRKIKNQRVLEEVRLSMTHKANAILAESNFSIDTDELTKKVSLLKEKEEQFYKLVFNDDSSKAENIDEKADLFENTLKKVSEIREMPVEILARFSSAEEFSLQDVYDAGAPLKQRYDDAVKTYEAVGTSVRADLGDNIQDAFRNVDDILKDLGFETTYDNQRAVRILGYNNIAITENNIENVRYVDRQVRSLIEKMNPAATMKLIQMRINPIEIDVATLSDIVDNISEENNDNAEGYAKFLLKLEHNHEITDEEANSYIGIYRLFDKIEKSDGAIIGSLISSGKDLTLKNLLTESRNHKKYGKIDKFIDDEQPLTEAQENSENLKIDTQIETAFQDDYLRHSSAEILKKMNPGALKNSDINENSTLAEVLDSLEKYSEENEEVLKAEYAEAAAEMKSAARADVEIYNILKQLDIKMSADNINAAAAIFRSRGSYLSRLFDDAEKDDKKDLEEEAERLADSFDDEEKAKKAYLKFNKKASKILNSLEMDQNKRIDLKSLQLVGKELSVAKSLANHEDYEVPVFMDGKLTSINLRIVHGEGEGRVDIRIETESLGNVSAGFTIKNGEADGTIISDKTDSTLKWKNASERLSDLLDKNGIKLKGLNTVTETNVRKSRIIKEYSNISNDKSQKADSTDLYRLAKCFISVIRNFDFLSR